MSLRGALGAVASSIGADRDPVIQVHFAWHGGDATRDAANMLRVQGRMFGREAPYFNMIPQGGGFPEVWIRFEALFVPCAVAVEVVAAIDTLLRSGRGWPSGLRTSRLTRQETDALLRLREGIVYQGLHNYATRCGALARAVASGALPRSVERGD